MKSPFYKNVGDLTRDKHKKVDDLKAMVNVVCVWWGVEGWGEEKRKEGACAPS